MEIQPQNAELKRYKGFSDLYLFDLKTKDRLNVTLLLTCRRIVKF